MVTIDKIRLHNILSIMVKDNKISLIERNSILSKAGLYYQGNSEWYDDNGTKYILKE